MLKNIQYILTYLLQCHVKKLILWAVMLVFFLYEALKKAINKLD